MARATFTEKVAGTKVFKNIVSEVLKNSNVDTTNEYSSLVQVKNACSTDISRRARIYLDIMELDGFCPNLKYFNDCGWKYKDLEFHKHFIASSSLSTILQGKVNKVVQDNTKISEQDIDIALFKEIQTNLSIYGECLICAEEIGQTFEESSFVIIEPYRYIVNENETIVYTYTGNIGNVIHFEKRVFEKTDNGENIRMYDCVINKKGELEKRLVGETTVTVATYIIDKDVDDLQNIKYALALIDLTETVQALEVKNSSFKIHADEKYFQNGNVIVNDYYRIYQNSTNDTPPMFNSFQPLLRQADYREIKNEYRLAICNELGMNSRSLGFAEVTNQLATVALLDEENTTNTINSEKTALKDKLQEFLNYFFDNQELIMPSYINDSMSIKAQMLKDLSGNISIEKTVDILYPTLDEEKKMVEVILIKVQKGLPLTVEQQQFAEKNGIDSGGVGI